MNELRKIGIEVLVISSDSDTRYNKVMRDLSGLGKQTPINWFSSEENFHHTFYFQDTVHIGTKLRIFFFINTLCFSKSTIRKLFY